MHVQEGMCFPFYTPLNAVCYYPYNTVCMGAFFTNLLVCVTPGDAGCGMRDFFAFRGLEEFLVLFHPRHSTQALLLAMSKIWHGLMKRECLPCSFIPFTCLFAVWACCSVTQ